MTLRMELTDLEKATLGFEIDLATASAEARLAVWLSEARQSAELVTAGLLTAQRARDTLVARAAELRTGLDSTEAERVLGSYLKAAASTVALPRIELNDASTWTTWIEAATGDMSAARLRSPSFVSIHLTQVTLARLAELCPAAEPWQSLVLAVQKLEEAQQTAEELTNAQRTIRQLRARLAELNDG